MNYSKLIGKTVTIYISNNEMYTGKLIEVTENEMCIIDNHNCKITVERHFVERVGKCGLSL